MTMSSIEQISFYETRQSGDIMSPKSFSEAILKFNRLESLYAQQVLHHYHYDYLVELGCHDGRNLEVAMLQQAGYIGIDLNPQAIESLCSYVHLSRLTDRASAHQVNLKRVEDVVRLVPEGRKALYMFPFNLIGNFTDAEDIFAAYGEQQCSLLVSCFDTTEYATQIRQQYYRSSGLHDLTYKRQPQGVAFMASGAFCSLAMYHDWLIHIALRAGYILQSMQRNLVGRVYHLVPGSKYVPANGRRPACEFAQPAS